MRFYIIGLTVLILTALGGCNDGEKSAPPAAPLLPEHVDEIHIQSEFKGKPLCLTEEYHAYRAAHFATAYNVPLELCETLRTDIIIEYDNGIMRVDKANNSDMLSWRIGMQANLFNKVAIKMRVEGDEDVKFSWRSDRDPRSTFNEGIQLPIIPDGEMHEYVLDLSGDNLYLWSGDIQRFNLHFSSKIPHATIESIQFRYEQQPRPEIYGMAFEEHEGLPPFRYKWDFTVPDNAQFRTYCGIAPSTMYNPEDKYELLGDGVEFEVLLLDVTSGEVLLEEKRALTPAWDEEKIWQELSLNLSAFAGKHAHLMLDILERETSEGDFAFWGNPVVFQKAKADERQLLALVSLDTLRRDHVSVYGYERETTPHIAALAQDAVVFEDALTPMTWTLPAHASMFTGLHPSRHKVDSTRNLDFTIPTFPQQLRQAGYLNFGATGHYWWLMGERCFSRGMDFYDMSPGYRYFGDTMDMGLNWLGSHPNSKTFLFLHSYDIHGKFPELGFAEPYHPGGEAWLHFSKQYEVPEIFRDLTDTSSIGMEFLTQINTQNRRIKEEEKEYIIALYDDAVRYADAQLGRFIDYLKQEGLYDKAMIIVTSDHGESFGEHGIYGHEQVYDELARVPLVIKFPDNADAGRRIHGQVMLQDLYPTILSEIGAEIPPGLDGISLQDLIEEENPGHEYAFINQRAQMAIRTTDNKYITYKKEKEDEFFDLIRDPGENKNISGTLPELEKDLSDRVANFFVVDKTGWNMAVMGVIHPQNVRIQVEAATRIASYTLRGQEDITQITLADSEHISLDRKFLETTFGLSDNDRDFLYVKPYTNTDTFSAIVSCSGDMQLQLGSKPMQQGRSFTIMLDPSDPAMAKPENLGELENGELVAVHIWYEPVEEGQGAAPVMNAEIEQQLKGLGYLGDE